MKLLIDFLILCYKDLNKQRKHHLKEEANFCKNVNSLYYYFQKIDVNRSGSYIDPPEWLKNMKSTVNPKNKDNDKTKIICLKYAKPSRH